MMRSQAGRARETALTRNTRKEAGERADSRARHPVNAIGVDETDRRPAYSVPQMSGANLCCQAR